MLIKKPDDIKSSEITPEDTYLNRRKFLAAAGIAAAGIVGSGRLVSALAPARQQEDKPNTLGRDHGLQQLLRVRHGQRRSRGRTRRSSGRSRGR